jgi:outer membrane immunogenic protein
MKRTLLASTAICAFLAHSALAADLPTTKGPPPAPFASPFSWTGFYVGGNLGGVGTQDKASIAYEGYTLDADKFNLSGVVGGLQAGYNYQFQNYVIGVEGDVDWTSAKGKHDIFSYYYTHSTSLPFFADLRARFGYAFDRFLPYVTGGAVVANIRNSYDFDGYTQDRGDTSIGWTIGAGLEYAIDNHWSVKAEYLYMQFPDVKKNFDDGYYTFKFQDTAQVGRVGVNYRF